MASVPIVNNIFTVLRLVVCTFLISQFVLVLSGYQDREVGAENQLSIVGKYESIGSTLLIL